MISEMCLKVKLNLNYPQFIRQRMNRVRFTASEGPL